VAETIQIPNFQFASFYYTDLLDSLIQFKRENVPELTDESEFEPLIQMLRAFALIGHLNNVNLDVLANESTLPTAVLAEQVRNMLKLIDYDLRPASPAQVVVLYKLSKILTATTVVIPDRAQCSTPKEPGVVQLFFEADDELSVDRTDELSYVFGEDGGVFTDYTTEANDATTPAGDWAPWTTPDVGDSFYLGHNQALWNLLRWTLTTAMSGIVGVWEYFDGNFNKGNPDSIQDNGGNLTFNLNGYLGTTSKEGTNIRVRLNDTGAFEDAISTWNGSQNQVITGLLGQTTPSFVSTDYTIGAEWEELSGISDETSNLAVDGDLSFGLPQTSTENWIAGTVNGVSAFWIRFRIVSSSSPVSPVFQRARIDAGDQYVTRQVTQGQTQQDNGFASSTGLPDQSFQVTKSNFIDGSMEVQVDAVLWTEVDNFLSSQPNDEHYVVTLTDDNAAIIEFGDGITGKVPPLGVNNIDATYRYGAETNGNTGAESITVDKTGVSFVSSLTNPRPAQGWSQADTASDESLAQAKVLGPASLRVIHTALSPTDVITVTRTFQNDEGARPFSRAQAFEEGFGPKTLELVVVIKGGGQATQEQLDDLSLHFNGDMFAQPPIQGHYVSNQQVTAVNFTQRPINIDASVTSSSVTSEQIVNALAKVFQPEALKSDGVTYEWEFGAKVPVTRIVHEIYATDDSITDVTLNLPVGDVFLTKRELPILGTANIIVSAT
jgi:hypothetical protein